jgi:hypothetical protein
MKRFELIKRVRVLTRDLSNSMFRESDIVDFLNDGIDRVMQVFPPLVIPYLTGVSDIPSYLPERYHSLLSVYATSRCFAQDDRQYQAISYMNEFETKLDELKMLVDLGVVKIIDTVTNLPFAFALEMDTVVDNYFDNQEEIVDLDNGVEGVE